MKPQQLWATSTKLVMFPEESKAWSNEEKNGYTSHGKYELWVKYERMVRQTSTKP